MWMLPLTACINYAVTRVDVAELLARDAFAKGAYMLGAEDREIMLK